MARPAGKKKRANHRRTPYTAYPLPVRVPSSHENAQALRATQRVRAFRPRRAAVDRLATAAGASIGTAAAHCASPTPTPPLSRSRERPPVAQMKAEAEDEPPLPPPPRLTTDLLLLPPSRASAWPPPTVRPTPLLPIAAPRLGLDSHARACPSAPRSRPPPHPLPARRADQGRGGGRAAAHGAPPHALAPLASEVRGRKRASAKLSPPVRL